MLVSMTAAGAAAYTPRPGVIFNWPIGTRAEKLRIITHMNRTIRSTPRGAEIKIAQYSFDRPEITESLLEAYRRGVSVQMLLNDNWTTRETLRLQRVIGKDRAKRSFVYICHGPCRGRGGNLHSKFFLFSRAGAARNVVMVGSANMTDNSALIQWNDMFTVRSRGMYDLYSRVFAEMVPDRPVSTPYIKATVGDLENEFYPIYQPTRAKDPVLQRLNAVRCRGATGGTGAGGRTVIKIAMFGWAGTRGDYLADKVASLRRNGCNIRVIVSRSGGHVVRTLKAAGIPVKSASLDRNHNGSIDLYTHTKYMLLSGRYRGGSSWNVWTGSANWAARSFNNDEATVRIPRRSTYLRYSGHFARLWATAYWL
jgi:phosphatidylserine/phosphatidylglycerophosphate/cardiolipin synthase-like enzyme